MRITAPPIDMPMVMGRALESGGLLDGAARREREREREREKREREREREEREGEEREREN